MSTPRIEINLNKIAHNAKLLNKLYGSKGIDITGVTKVVGGNPYVASTLIKCGISMLADSRLTNIKRMRRAALKAEFLLLSTPFMSQVEDVVRYTDISMNTELSIIKKLSKFAARYRIKHKIILMVELGDLREGIMPLDLDDTIDQVLELRGIELAGIGANLACFGAIKPDKAKMEYLSFIARGIEEKYGIKLKFVSGGNSANYNWFISTNEVGKINNLRLGESIFLGRETLQGKAIPGLRTDAFTLFAEVMESKFKPSLPYGETAQDAFGNVPSFKDRGNINRAILGLGHQDVLVSGLTPRSEIEIIGASSDHIVVDSKKTNLKAGDEVEFDMNYGALLSAMTSPYVYKKIKDNLWMPRNIAKALKKNTAVIKKTFQPSMSKKTIPD